ncbi:MAG: hypothetical protein ACTSVK_18190 [Promethearchaeota archaeon]
MDEAILNHNKQISCLILLTSYSNDSFHIQEFQNKLPILITLLGKISDSDYNKLTFFLDRIYRGLNNLLNKQNCDKYDMIRIITQARRDCDNSEEENTIFGNILVNILDN